MGRRSGVVGVLNAISRDIARAQRQAEAERRRAAREAVRFARDQERAARQRQRDAVAVAREAHRNYIEDQQQEAADRTAELETRVEELAGVLAHTLTVDDAIGFDSLRKREHFPPFQPPQALTTPILPPDPRAYEPLPLGWLDALLPWKQRAYEAAKQQGAANYDAALRRDKAREVARLHELEQARLSHEAAKEEALGQIRAHNATVDEFERSYLAGDPASIVAYCNMVLERSEYPDGFPQQFRTAFAADSRELVVDYQLPGADLIPAELEFRYNKTKDILESKLRKKTEIKQRYQDLVAAIALRTLHEVFEADRPRHIALITFSGYVEGVDPATGRDVSPYLISVRATRERFEEIDLHRVDTRACLRNLGASVSASADELVPVKPIIHFDMIDKRFVDGTDVLSQLDARPNIMDLNPFEFENLVGNVFGKMGLETRQTRSSRDGGVDVVAYDQRPVLGGKVVIQAKRYRNTVGVAAVRDLYGTMINEGANKGILVTTAGYGSDAYTFASDKPIELIDGGGFLYLCEQVGVQARIVFPADAV